MTNCRTRNVSFAEGGMDVLGGPSPFPALFNPPQSGRASGVGVLHRAEAQDIAVAMSCNAVPVLSAQAKRRPKQASWLDPSKDSAFLKLN
eukprot:CAMPEP_0171517966 /NCGR_PEP_ID=MMETSP0959-20130129/4994_1 /TAXON_ID=87120 /ORGANISM="Aurantiochytrium limacinum, Strain ATCCMYA-1381" /LENGTH=89 /DNA_ID=CAMNT_0012057063 /DNA_START=747 /DNA_END=1017 /DNA_ORIENTATION=+